MQERQVQRWMPVQSRMATHVPETHEFIQTFIILNQRKGMNAQNWLSCNGPILQGLPGMTKGVQHHTGSGSCSPKHNCFPRRAATRRICLVLGWLPRALASTIAQSPVFLIPKKQLLIAWAVILRLRNHMSYYKGNVEITIWSAWHLKRSIHHVDTYKQKMRPYCIMSSSFLACFKRGNLYNVKTHFRLWMGHFSLCFFPDSRSSFFLHQKKFYLKQLLTLVLKTSWSL